MNAWLGVAEVAVILGAVVGAFFLRRRADREWAEVQRREWLRASADRIVALPAIEQMVAGIVEVRLVLQDSFAPALQRAAASIADLSKAFDVLPREPWWRRTLLRVRGWFA